MTPDLLRQIGEALYGMAWVPPMAHQLDISKKSMHRMAVGYSRIPPGVQAALLRLCEDQPELLGELLPRLKKVVSEAR